MARRFHSNGAPTPPQPHPEIFTTASVLKTNDLLNFADHKNNQLTEGFLLPRTDCGH